MAAVAAERHREDGPGAVHLNQRIEPGELALESVDFDLDLLLSRCRELLDETARAKGVELTIDAAGLPRWLRGDPTPLSQALVNLLDNAVKFTERGTVTLPGRVLAETLRDTHLRFEVRDTGIGIAPARVGAAPSGGRFGFSPLNR